MNDLFSVPTSELTVLQAADSVMKLQQLQKQIDERLPELRATLLQKLKENDVEQLKTGSYTISRVRRVTPIIEDEQEVFDALNEAKIPISSSFTVKPDKMTALAAMLKKLGVDNQYLQLSPDRMQMVSAAKQFEKSGVEFSGVRYSVVEYPMIRLKEKEAK